MKMEIGEGKRTIYLFSPSSAKTVQIAVWEEQMLDLGSIARAFELDPTSLKLNGHFIARGVDFIASSVTWRSLLSFFSARGLSTGATVSDPLIVDGKVSKLGWKSNHEDTKDGRTLGLTISSGEYSCSGFDKNMKRNREDNLDLVNSHKRTRV